LPELKKWHESGIVLSIFSSGSVEAQKLFFKYVGSSADTDSNGDDKQVGEKRKAVDESINGEEKSTKKVKTDIDDKELGTKQTTEDLNPLFVSNFDTVNAGPKKEAESYEKIVKELGKEVGECLFLSDNVDEVFAAEKAGLKALVVDRPGNALISEEDKAATTLITSLDEIDLDVGEEAA